jgi:hypothetical protein
MATKLNKEFQNFISNHNPKQVSRHLRIILLEYIEAQLDTGLPVDFRATLWEMNDLFSLLDEAEDMQARGVPR